MGVTRIVLDVPDHFDFNGELVTFTEHQLSLLLMDAMYEFQMNRANGNARAYVERRYPLTANCAYPEGPDRERKVRQVQQRFIWADAMHSARVVSLTHVNDEE